MKKLISRSLIAAVALSGLLFSPAQAQQPVISEIAAATSQQTLRKDSAGLLRMGSGTAWYEPGYDASWWPVGHGRWGYGSSVGTNTQTAMQGRTAMLYLRREFQVTAAQAASTLPLFLYRDYDDGCVVYLNGREVGRRNAGPAGSFVFATQNAYNIRPSGAAEVQSMGAANGWLVPGTNVIAAQVLNHTMDDVSMDFAATLVMQGPVEFATAADDWRWLPGLCEPSGGVTDPTDWAAAIASPLAPAPEFLDWIELHNPAATPADLGGWRLSDDPAQLAKWTFPAGTSIPAGGRLVVAASGRNVIAPPPGGMLHTNFKLKDSGETVLLSPPAGGVVSQLAYPAQSAHASYGLSPVDGSLSYLEKATPGLPNAGPVFTAAPAAPVADKESAHYAGTFSVALTSPTPGSVIRYTVDGSEPTATSPLYTAPFDPASPAGASPRWACLRARAFVAGALPSAILTRTYLVNYDARLRTLPSLCLNGDPATTFYGPNSVLSIVGGSYTGTGPFGLTNVWKPTDAARDYNIPTQYGKAWEKPAAFEILDALPGALPIRTDAGLRISGSVAVRPYYTFPNAQTTRWDGSFLTKPSFNLYFRDDYGGGQFGGAIFPPSTVANHSSFRLRAGHNDYLNPFFKDELMRRLFYDTGHSALLGRLANLYINGHHKGYYSLIERGREDFLREWYQVDNGYDVITPFTEDASDGDKVVHDATLTFLQTTNFTVLANYQAAASKIDLDNYLDYILINAWGATGDWPTNNFIAYRERATAPAIGPWRYLMWDAEGAMGDFGHTVNYNTFTADLRNAPSLLITTAPYRYLWPSAEFKLKAADRVQRLFFHNGAMTQANIQSRFLTLRDEMNPTMQYVRGVPVNETFFNNWWPTRRGILFTQLQGEGFWPATLATVFAPHGGSVATGSIVSLTNPNATGTIYSTTNGEDPRLPGGAVNPNALTAASVAINEPALLQSRVLRGTEWSPLEAATYATTPARIVVSEIFYNPPGSAETGEFIELMNAGPATVSLSGLHFTEGLEFAFTSGTLAPCARLVLVKDAAVFAAAHPGVTIGGVYAGSLSNSGELLELRDLADGIVFSFIFPTTFGDGDGRSQVLRRPATATNATSANAISWRPSALPGGSPGASDSTVFTGLAAADADHDDYKALLEYGFGTSDTDGQSRPIITTIFGSDGTISATAPWAIATDDVDLIAETSTDLQTWTPAPAAPTFAVPASGGVGTMHWQIAAPVPTPQKYFFHLRAAQTPP